MHGAQSIQDGESGNCDDDGQLHHEEKGSRFAMLRGRHRVDAIYT